MPLYVIGRQSLFGYPYAHHQYIDPVTKDVYHPLIRRGPETADIELYQWDGLYERLAEPADLTELPRALRERLAGLPELKPALRPVRHWSWGHSRRGPPASAPAE